jgi:peptide/nickel transport system substrate-binding protein
VKQTTRFAMAIVMALLFVVAGCAAPASAPAAVPTPAGGTEPAAVPTQAVSAEESRLVVAFPGSVEQLDPNYSIGSTSAQTVVSNIYDQLTEFETHMSADGYLVDDTESIVGAVAESYEVSPDGKTITYHIRDGATFHDGTPLTAEAVKFTFDRIVESQGVSWYYVDMAGARTKADYEVVDDSTLAVHLAEPNDLAIKLLTLQNIVPVNPTLLREHMTADDPFGQNWLSINDAGSGPFVLESFQPESEVVLRRFDDYWRGPAAFERVIIKIIPNVADRILALESGDVDMIMDVPPRDIERLKANPDIKMISAPSRKMVYLGLTYDIAPFDNIQVRQAVAYAIPYETILQEVYKGAARALRSPVVAQGTPTYTEDFWSYETDLDKARELLAEAGYADGFETTLVVKAGLEEDEEMAVWIKANLEQIGIKVNVQSMPLGAYMTEARAHSLPMFIDYDCFWVNDPFYGDYFAIQTDGGANQTDYSNAEVDSLIKEYLASTDAEARAEASRRVQEITCEELPQIPLAQVNVNVAMRSNVQGFYFSFDGTHVTRFYTMYKE